MIPHGQKDNLHLTGGHFFVVCMAGLVKLPIPHYACRAALTAAAGIHLPPV